MLRVSSIEYVLTPINELQWRFANLEDEDSKLINQHEYGEVIKELTGYKGYTVVWTDGDILYLGRVFIIDPNEHEAIGSPRLDPS